MLRQLEKYELLEEIGHGGMATVYRARDTRLDRLVAVKVLHPHLRKTLEARERFTREAKSVAKLQHPNILEVYDYSGEESEESYIAVELLTGPTLKEEIERRGAMPAEVAACVALELSEALSAAHQSAIIHRDVKPENALFHEGRTVKLTDFGIAQMVDSKYTATGQILGSPGHMAPEQIDGGEIDERSDLFSLGTVIYYLVVGRLPFTGRNPHEILRRLTDVDYVDPLRALPAMGDRFAQIIRKLLQRAPSDRYEDAHALREALLAYLQFTAVADPKALLRAYLADPDHVRETLRAQAIRSGLQAAKTLGKTERRAAMSALDRVLALDEGNAEALSLVRSLSGAGWSRAHWAALLVATLLLLVGAGFWAWQSDAEASNEALAPDHGSLDAGAQDAMSEPDAGIEDASDAALVDAHRDLAADAPPRARSDAGTRPSTMNATSQEGPRLVVFQPRPANVQISVDGAPLRAFGPEFHQMELSPGPHRFRVIGAGGCCEEISLTQVIPRGEGSYPLRFQLRYRPAPLYVEANIPASVEVEGRGAAQGVAGRSRTILYVPMSEGSDRRRVVVSAPGHEPQSTLVTLQAGASAPARVSVTLRATP